MLEPPPSRLLLTLAGGLTQALGAAYLVLGIAALPIAHDLHGGTRSVIVSIAAALATVACGNLVYRGRMIPIALAVGLDVGFGIALAHGTTAIGALLHILPDKSDPTARTIATFGAMAMFTAAALCILAIPVALRLRAWARQGMESGPHQAGGAATTDPTESELHDDSRGGIPATQILYLRKSSKTAIIIVVSATLIAVGLVVTTIGTGSSDGEVVNMASSEGSRPGSGSTEPTHAAADAGGAPQPPTDAPVAPVPVVPEVADAISQFHVAVGNVATKGGLERLLDPNVFAFGVGAQDVAQGRAAVVAMFRKNLGLGASGSVPVAGYFTKIGVDGDVGWFGEEMRIGKTTYVVSAALGLHDGAWSIFALHWALALPNSVAHQLAYRRELELPDSIPNGRHDTPLAKTMLAAFSSRSAFIDARSSRPDAFNFGSAPGERSAGESAKRIFAQLKAKIRVHDTVNVGAIGEHGGWGAANVDYTDADDAGHEITQTFRVLVVWLLEDDHWRIVQTQWSNGH